MRARTNISWGPPISPVVRILLFINIAIFACLTLFGGQVHAALGVPYEALFMSMFGLQPQAIIHQKTIWQLVTFLFIHGHFWHLLFNMLGLWWFGSDLERVWGSRTFFRYFLFTGIGSGVISMAMNLPTIGASGSIYGLLFAFGMLYPNRVIYLYFVLPIKAKYFVLLFGLIELALLVSSKTSGINHWAHLGGLFFGFIWFFLARNQINFTQLLRRYRYYKHRKKFTLIVNEKDAELERKKLFDDDNNPTIH